MEILWSFLILLLYCLSRCNSRVRAGPGLPLRPGAGHRGRQRPAVTAGGCAGAARAAAAPSSPGTPEPPRRRWGDSFPSRAPCGARPGSSASAFPARGRAEPGAGARPAGPAGSSPGGQRGRGAGPDPSPRPALGARPGSHPRRGVAGPTGGLTASTACCRMEVNLENILSRDCSSRCREDLESSSIRRRRRSRREEGFISPPNQIRQRKRSSLPFYSATGKAEAWRATDQVPGGSKY
ncbi:translation initiation factor IF-2-like [Corvus cornix cornix]|uniref:translation initiation factor IF-2-like n=1 Tax=Corvus cornix cornix TaxID=932674 RepID=UPI00195249E3|nr:translation initiation factor IF-2-like [Corvus cornix cornix]